MCDLEMIEAMAERDVLDCLGKKELTECWKIFCKENGIRETVSVMELDEKQLCELKVAYVCTVARKEGRCPDMGEAASAMEDISDDMIQEMFMEVSNAPQKDEEDVCLVETDGVRSLAAAIIDLFEELLDRHGIDIPSRDRDVEKKGMGEGDVENAGFSHIYGTEYYELEDAVVELLKSRNELTDGVLSEEEIDTFNAYIENCDMRVAFGNTDWCGIYAKIVGTRRSEKIQEWMERY